jgi:hypothetical protein
MTNIINYDEFISNKKILYYCKYNNDREFYTFIYQNIDNVDFITYYNTEYFYIPNFLQLDTNGNFYYEYTPNKIGDIIDNIKIEPSNIKINYNINNNIKNDTSNIKISYSINNNIYDSKYFTEFIYIATLYSKFKIRITFIGIPNNNINFIIYYRLYITNKKHIDLFQKNKIYNKNYIYENGILTLNNSLNDKVYDNSLSGSIIYDNSLSGKIYNNSLSGIIHDKIYDNSLSGIIHDKIYDNSLSGKIYDNSLSGIIHDKIYDNSLSGKIYDNYIISCKMYNIIT